MPGTRTHLAPAACVSVTDDLDVCARIDATIEVERVDDAIVATLAAGAVELFGADEPRSVALATPAGTITATNAVFAVTLTESGAQIDRLAGEVELRGHGDALAAAARPVPQIDGGAARDAADAPAKWLERAQSRLAAGDATRAIAAYEALVKLHPRSTEARTALVSLANLLLLRGRHARALKYYERHLAGDGELVEEAMSGRIGALHGLGRRDEAREASARFLARYPDSLYAPRVRRWASE